MLLLSAAAVFNCPNFTIKFIGRTEMDNYFLQLLLFGTIAGLANVLGGLLLYPSAKNREYSWSLKYLLAIGAGFMLAVTFFEIVPRTVILWQTTYPESSDSLYAPMFLILVGYLLTQFFEHTVAPHFHLGEELHKEHIIPAKTAYSAVGGLLIHTFFDGIAIAAASQIDIRVGLLVFIAVFLHKFPEGFAIGSTIVAAGKEFREVMIATTLVGVMTLLGVLFFYVIGSSIGLSVNYALPLACGVTLYVAASDLIPEINHHGGRKTLVSLSIFVGAAVFFAIHYIVHELLEH